MSTIDTKVLKIEKSDLSGEPIPTEEPSYITVLLKGGLKRRLAVTAGEAKALAEAGTPERGWVRRTGAFVAGNWVKGLVAIFTLILAGLVLPAVMKVWVDRQQELQAKVRLIRTINESASKLYSTASEAAALSDTHERAVKGQKVVDSWVGAEGTIDPQIGILFGEAERVRTYWRDFRQAEFRYATLSHCCKATRADDVAFINGYLRDKRPRQTPDGVPSNFMSEVQCGPPSGCANSHERYRKAYRWMGVLLIDTTQGLSREVMKSSAAGFSHWPPQWVHKAVGT
jgi:hypothetical protein